jgi:hypothetical protein
VGIVSAVAGSDNFTLHYGGLIDTLSGLTAGEVYFLSPSSAGDLTTTEPSLSGQVSKPLFIAVSTTSGYWFNFRGQEIADSNESAGALRRDIAQTAHGFDVGDVVYFDGSEYALAQADDPVTAEVAGIVAEDTDANNFVLHYGGHITGLSSLTAGEVYFLSETTAGSLAITAPSSVGEISKPLLIADTTTSGYWFNFRGIEVGSAEQTLHHFNYMFFK